MTIRPAVPRVASVRPSSLCLWGTALAAVAIVLAGAASRAGTDDPPARPKTIVLFDGKSLDGWKRTDFSSTGDVKVADGAIVMAEGNPMTGITSTRKDLPTFNYELTYEARRIAGHDFFAAATFPVGKSFITLVNGGWGGNVTGLSSLDGQDASENETTKGYSYKDRTWYRFRVRVTGDVIRCWINDQQVVDVNYANRQVRTRIETNMNQPLGFATWEAGGALRRIEVRLLTPAEVAATKKPLD
jgi:hypothetical protein